MATGETPRRSSRIPKNADERILSPHIEIDKENFRNRNRRNSVAGVSATPLSTVKRIVTALTTPRRSVRKSFRPLQEYEAIVAQKGLEAVADRETEPARWTPAKVGRVYNKRSKRAHRSSKAKQSEEVKKNLKEVEDESCYESDADNTEHTKVKHSSEVNGEVTDNRGTEWKVIQVQKQSLTPRKCNQNKEDELSSLIIVDDEQEEPSETEVEKSSSKNRTFDGNDSDCVLVSMSEEEPVSQDAKKDATFDTEECTTESPTKNKQNDELEEQLFVELESGINKLDPLDDTTVIDPLNVPQIILNDVEGNTKALNVTMEEKCSTPKLRPPAYRFPTPYKSKDSLNLSFTINEETPDNAYEFPHKNFSVTTLDPKEIVIKSIRKRSLSVSINAARKNHHVKFHSPANIITDVGDIDKHFANSAKKATTLESDAKNVTKRRKRSISVDNINRKTKKDAPENTPSKLKSISQPTSRTKLPNFAAIHRQQFNKMESISDHMQRKAERALNIISSGSKFKNASSQKVPQNQNKNLNASSSSVTRPKARQRINLTPLKTAREDFNKATSGFKPLAGGNDVSLVKLPILAAMPKVAKCTTVGSTSVASKSANKIKPKPTTRTQIPSVKPIISKPKFDLSTHISNVLPLSTHTENRLNKTEFVFGAGTSSKPKLNMSKVVAKPQGAPIAASTSTYKTSRHEKLIGLYKSRATTRPDAKKRQNEILRGVRTNRRFELQMMCRNNQIHSDK